MGLYAKNKFGLFDTVGNVWEWCGDVYDEKAYAGRTRTTDDPSVNAGSVLRVLRGGSWYYYARSTRSAFRLRNSPDFRDYSSGFRVVCDSSIARRVIPAGRNWDVHECPGCAVVQSKAAVLCREVFDTLPDSLSAQ